MLPVNRKRKLFWSGREKAPAESKREVRFQEGLVGAIQLMDDAAGRVAATPPSPEPSAISQTKW